MEIRQTCIGDLQGSRLVPVPDSTKSERFNRLELLVHRFQIDPNHPGYEFAGFGQTWRENLTGKVLHLPNAQRFKVEDVYQIAHMYDAFADAILGGAPFIADGPMGLRDMIILDAVQRAAVTGVAQELPPLTGT